MIKKEQYMFIMSSLLDRLKFSVLQDVNTSTDTIEQQGPFAVILQNLVMIQDDFLQQLKGNVSEEEYELVKSTLLQVQVQEYPLEESLLDADDLDSIDDITEKDNQPFPNNVFEFRPKKEPIQ